MVTPLKPKTTGATSNSKLGSEVWIGIDPGANGGISRILHKDHTQLVEAYNLPDNLPELVELIGGLSKGDWVSCALEQVGGYIGKPQPGSRMFTFGRGFGQIEGILHVLRVPHYLVVPTRWQSEFNPPALKKGAPKSQHKKNLKAIACRLFPQVKITNTTADSVLLAEYCRRKSLGILQPKKGK